MEAFSNILASISGAPAIIGLFLTALITFLTSDRRLALAALLAQYLLVGLTLTRFIQPEVAAVKILVGVLVVPILYLGPRGGEPATEPATEPAPTNKGALQFMGLTVGWDAGPLGLPLRFLAVLLTILMITLLLSQFHIPQVPTQIAFVAVWMASLGLMGLVLGGGSLRAALAVLTILSGFEMVHAGLERSLAIAGFYGALTLLTALAFSYLIAVQSLRSQPGPPNQEATEL